VISLDTNLLFLAFAADRPEHGAAQDFVKALSMRDDVAVSEFVMIEFYNLLRNPAVVRRPLSSADAVEVVQVYRRHPAWMLLGFTSDSVRLHDALWSWAARPDATRNRLYDARLALTLRHHGVTEFATRNVKDFQGFGFKKVWDPLGACRT
jgi:hypothetical protein